MAFESHKNQETYIIASLPDHQPELLMPTTEISLGAFAFLRKLILRQKKNASCHNRVYIGDVDLGEWKSQGAIRLELETRMNTNETLVSFI